MLEKFLGLETLRSGLNDYLNTHKYSNAETEDLWTVLSKHANETVQVKVKVIISNFIFYLYVAYRIYIILFSL